MKKKKMRQIITVFPFKKKKGIFHNHTEFFIELFTSHPSLTFCPLNIFLVARRIHKFGFHILLFAR